MSLWSGLQHLFGKTKTSLLATLPLPADIAGQDLIAQLAYQFQGSNDVKFHDIVLDGLGFQGTLIYAEGLIDKQRIEETIVQPLLRWARSAAPHELHEVRDPAQLASRILNVAEAETAKDFEHAVAAILAGDVLLTFAGQRVGLIINNRGWQRRSVSDPVLEVTVRGPRDSFTETLFTNTALIRRRLRDPNLRIVVKKIGRRTRTDVALIYVEGVTAPGLAEEISKRLESIDIDGVLDTGYIEQLIEDEWYSPFPQHLKTERPDRAVAALLEGRAVLLADTTPFALIMPATLESFFHSPEDSYDRYFPVTLLRTIRFIAAVFGLIGPALYVALAAYHPDIMPTELALRIKSSREGVAFPVLIEALLMQFFLELIKEAGLRLPGPLGQTFGIVGGLILGDIGIRAGLVSEAMVVVVAATAISTFASIDREMGTVVRLLGLPVMLSTAVLGLYGLVMATLLIAIHLATLRSYDVPYLAPFPYYQWSDLKDTATKAPLRSFRMRPEFLHSPERVRMRDRSDPPTAKEKAQQ